MDDGVIPCGNGSKPATGPNDEFSCGRVKAPPPLMTETEEHFALSGVHVGLKLNAEER